MTLRSYLNAEGYLLFRWLRLRWSRRRRARLRGLQSITLKEPLPQEAIDSLNRGLATPALPQGHCADCKAAYGLTIVHGGGYQCGDTAADVAHWNELQSRGKRANAQSARQQNIFVQTANDIWGEGALPLRRPVPRQWKDRRELDPGWNRALEHMKRQGQRAAELPPTRSPELDSLLQSLVNAPPRADYEGMANAANPPGFNLTPPGTSNRARISDSSWLTPKKRNR